MPDGVVYEARQITRAGSSRRRLDTDAVSTWAEHRRGMSALICSCSRSASEGAHAASARIFDAATDGWIAAAIGSLSWGRKSGIMSRYKAVEPARANRAGSPPRGVEIRSRNRSESRRQTAFPRDIGPNGAALRPLSGFASGAFAVATPLRPTLQHLQGFYVNPWVGWSRPTRSLLMPELGLGRIG